MSNYKLCTLIISSQDVVSNKLRDCSPAGYNMYYARWLYSYRIQQKLC